MPKRARKPEWFDAIIFDGNGIARGLRAPKAQMDAMMKNGITWPVSLFAMRFDGVCVEETGIGLSGGDPDGACMPIENTLSETPWRKGGMQAVFALQGANGKPHYADPRGVLDKTARRFEKDGWHPAAAMELEFYLSSPQAPLEADAMPELYSQDAMLRSEEFLDLLARSMEEMNVRGGAMISEYGGGQMEVNLQHGEPRRACLDGLLLRYLVRRCAESMNMRATFLAKPKQNAAGNGMHVHLSFARKENKDKKDKYLFANNAALSNAVAGVLSVMREGAAFLAPFDNSYRRFVPNAYAPISTSWGKENRAAAVRIPMAKTASEKRMEFRPAGADANPYLVLSMLLAGAHHGLQKKLKPPKEQKDGTPRGELLPMAWRTALDELSSAKILPKHMGAKFIKNYLAIKESEFRHHRDHISDYDREKYRTVI